MSRAPQHLITLLVIGALCAGCRGSGAGADSLTEGTQLWEQGQDNLALAAFVRGVAADPKHTPLRLALGRLHYERGEIPHLQQRRLLSEVEVAYKRNDREAAEALEARAESKRREASLSYRAANVELDAVLEQSSDPEPRAHAAYLRMRTAIFFEQWPAARSSVKTILDDAQLVGTQRARYEDFLQMLDRNTPHVLLPKDE
jgi:hypothetical protein